MATAIPFSIAFAQDGTGQQVEEPERIEEIIVTGVVEETSKKDATFSINTLDKDDFERLAPISTADLLGNVPGIFAEGSTAGEASNNITVRGLPVVGGYRYSPQLIDGLPWFEEPEVQFMNNDVAARGDLMTERVEVVKGGTGGILYSNGLGATVNHITRRGGQDFEGGYKLELSDYGFIRKDLFFSGPINDNLTFAVGGYYRVSDGLRDVGYTADNGGQIRGNLQFTSDDDSLTVELHGLTINDHTTFYQSLPFQVPAFTQRGTAENPIEIDPDQVWTLGYDFGDGSVASSSTRRFTQLGEYGRREVDLADGLAANFESGMFKVDKIFDNGLELSAAVRRTIGTTGFNAMFTGNDTTTAGRFLNARYQNDVISPAHSQALSGVYDGAKLVGFFDIPADPAAAFNNISRQDFINNYGLAQSVGAFYEDGSQVTDDTLMNFLLPFIAHTEAASQSYDFRASYRFDSMGTHDITVGIYGADYRTDQNFQSSLLVSALDGDSRLVELRGLNTGGEAFGPSLTLDGAILPGFFGFTSEVRADTEAVYLHDHWEMMNGDLKIDMGVRWQRQTSTVDRFDRAVSADSNLTPNGTVVGSDADTTADDEIQLPVNQRTSAGEYDGFGWSIGANYSISNDFAVYGLISDSFRLPSMEDLNEFKVDSNRIEEQVESIMQYEGGFRYYADTWDTQVAIFYNDFSPRGESVTYRDFTSTDCSVIGAIPEINSCPEVRDFYERGVKNLGMEVEFSWRPDFIEGLEFIGNLVVQTPEIQGSNFTTVREIRINDVVTGYEFEDIGEDGRSPRRLAEQMYNIQAVWDMRPIIGVPFKPYMKYTYFGERYSESRDVDVTLYPEYFHIDGGFIWDFSEDLAFQFHVSNITNELSFTEGDPLFADLKGPNGATNRGVARPLFGRTYRAMLNYWF